MSLNNAAPDLNSTQRNDVPYSKLGDLWSPYKTLQRIVLQYLTGTQNRMDFYDVGEFKKQLNLYKQSFMSLLQNPPKSSQHRDDLHRGMEEGINIRGIGHQILSRELYQEMCILSDMFDLNEYIALDLLCTAQIQMSYYPDLPRGLVAILLYYDGRKTVASMLRMLIQARKGVAWTTKASSEIEEFVTTYTDELASNGLLQRLLSLLSSLDMNTEMELLQSNLALGDVKHRNQVMELFENIRLLLADSLFLWSTNCGLSKAVTLNLIQHMRQIPLDESATGTLSHVTLLLEMSLLAAFDLSILHTREDGDSVVQSLPVLSESDFVETIFNELIQSDTQWTSSGLQAVTLFGFSVTLGALRTIPEGQRLQAIWDQVENLIDKALDLKALEFMHNVFLVDIYDEELIHRQLHFLFTDFVILLYNKVKQLRFKADDNARIIANYGQAGLEAPPNLVRHFEYLLLAMAKLYHNKSLNVDLVMQYWSQAEFASQYRSGTRDSSLAKFLHLCGDGIPSSIFVPYLTFLRSLSNDQKAARFCFNLMKQSSGPSLTWDHFFMSFAQYYNNLRYEHPPSQDTIYFKRQTSIATYHKGITPQELQGLHAVLKLITTIARYDDFSRLAFCEHPGWAPLTVFLGLVSCAVPPMLKADLLVALAALSKSQETAIQTWNNLEASQILVTVPSTSSFQPRGIQTELDEVESRVEEYPLTRAILQLLSVLVDSGIPRTLGAGPRKPGFDPYLTFIINSVFLKFSARSYKDPSEKWKVALNCLDLFDKFLLRYEPAAADFPNNNKQNEFNSPPGFHIMVQMNSKSEFLNTIWSVLEEGVEMHTNYVKAPHQEVLKQCTSVCLSILYNALILQAKFFVLLNTASCPIFLTSLNKLIMTINPRTGRPDYPLIIIQYVGYLDVAPLQSLIAVRILTYVTNTPLIHTQLMNILLSCTYLKDLRNVFVECMDEREDSGNEHGDATKVAILNLTRQCLPYPEPNLCHLLFGFDCNKGVGKTVFQLPGVRKFPRTCIHSLFAILQSTVKNAKSISVDVLEAAYNMLYVLCANMETSDATLRLLRMQANFFKEHVPMCFRKINDGHVELRQMSWLLKTLAIELKVSCASKQLSYLKFLSQLLVGIPSAESHISRNDFNLCESVKERVSKSTMLESMSRNNLLIELLITFNFNVKGIDAPEWEYFERPVLDKLLLSCETDNVIRTIDVKRLHKILVDELCAVQGGTAVGQRQGILAEIQRVLLHTLTINQARETAQSVLAFVEAWSQVTEIFVLHLPYEILSPKEQQLLEIYLLENILKIIVKNVVNVEVSSLLSGAVLLILVNLRKSHIREIRQRGLVSDEDDILIKESIIELNKTSMHNILRYLIQWLLSANVACQRLRAHLYSALLTFLRIYDSDPEEDLDKTTTADYVRCIDSSRYRIHDNHSTISFSQAATTNVLGEFNDKLVEILCYDCINGKRIIEMLAMAAFSLLISMSSNMKWISQISSKGYMKFIIESILSSDKELRNALEAEPDDLNIHTLYKYESRLKLINRIASTRLGAELLLEQSVLACLSNLKALDFHPQISKHWEKMDGMKVDIPSAEQRYMMLWIPSLQLCDTVLTSLGTDNESAIVQILHFLFSHLDAVEMILRAGNANLSLGSLTELAIMTSIICRSANNDLATLLDSNNVQQNNRAQLYRIQKLIIGLLPKFTLSESNIRELLSDFSNTSELNSYQTSQRLYYFMQVGCNLLMYARNVIANNGVEHGTVGVIFQPILADAVLFSKPQSNKSKFEQNQSLGVIIQMLIANVAFFHKEKATYDFLIRKKNEVPKMGSVELKDFVPMPTEIFDLVYMREDAVAMLTEKVRLKRAQMYHCRFQMEHCLYLLWAHLDYYMLKAIPKAKNFGLVQMNEQFNASATLASNTEAAWKVTTDDLSALKQDLVSIFNDSFCSQLVETTEESTEADKGLIETLLRKIKRLVQFVPVK